MKRKRIAFFGSVIVLAVAIIISIVVIVPALGEPEAQEITPKATLTKIDQYQIQYSANTFKPEIWLYSEEGSIGELRFYPDGETLPPDQQVNGYVVLQYHLQDFQNCIDMLRNEKPVYLLWAGSGEGFENGIRTLEEPVGEGEGPSAPPHADIYIQHTYRGDLIVDLECTHAITGDSWSQRIWNGEGGDADNLDLTVDLSGATNLLPPGPFQQWLLTVYDQAGGDTGQITEFSITYDGKTYTSDDPPVPINDYQTSYANISH